MTKLVSRQPLDDDFSDRPVGGPRVVSRVSPAVALDGVTLGPTGNCLLESLPKVEYRKLAPHLELVALPSGKILSVPGEPIRYSYFPTTAVISLVTPIEGHGLEEVAVVGCEGMTGVSLVLEGKAARGPSRRPIVDNPGYAYRVRADVLVAEFGGCIELEQLLLRYTHALINQIAQTKVCNRHHTVAQQLGRWLLQRLDRVRGRELLVTQQRIADLLGVRRASINAAANDFQRAGIIRCRHGYTMVLDRTQLEDRACECYAVLAKECAQVLQAPCTPHPPAMACRRMGVCRTPICETPPLVFTS